MLNTLKILKSWMSINGRNSIEKCYRRHQIEEPEAREKQTTINIEEQR